MISTIRLLLVEDNSSLRSAMKSGLEDTGKVTVSAETDRGEDAIGLALENPLDVILMDVQLAGSLNGVQAAIAIRREVPRLPVVFYSIQDDERFYRDFLASGILTHYAYVRKSNYLLPAMVVPLLRDAIAGRSFIDPDIEQRVQAVRLKDEDAPLELLEPNERDVVKLLAQGMTNEQIATRLNFRDRRAVSRTNGQIYAAWGLDNSTEDEKTARARATLIYNTGRMIIWDDDGTPRVRDAQGKWVMLF
ncbi:MAG TPA: response regulator transcription factor [Anaerolineae bacterium]|nr:response regulator transcription factor [Anaerolineae bacterium]